MGAKGSALAEPDVPLEEVVVPKNESQASNENVLRPSESQSVINDAPFHLSLHGLVPLEIDSEKELSTVEKLLVKNVPTNSKILSSQTASTNSTETVLTNVQSASELPSVHHEPPKNLITDLSDGNVPSTSKEYQKQLKLNQKLNGDKSVKQSTNNASSTTQPSSENCSKPAKNVAFNSKKSFQKNTPSLKEKLSSDTNAPTAKSLSSKVSVPETTATSNENLPLPPGSSKVLPTEDKKPKKKTFPWWKDKSNKNVPPEKIMTNDSNRPGPSSRNKKSKTGELPNKNSSLKIKTEGDVANANANRSTDPPPLELPIESQRERNGENLDGGSPQSVDAQRDDLQEVVVHGGRRNDLALLQILQIANAFAESSQVNRSLWRRFVYWNPNPNSCWVKAIIRSNLPGLRECVKPDINIFLRLFWFTMFWVCVSLVAVILTLAILKMVQQPILVVSDSVKVFTGKLPSPGVYVNLAYSFLKSKLYESYEIYANTTVYGPNSTDKRWTEEETVKLLTQIDEICTSTTSLSSLHNSHQELSLDLLKHWDYLKMNNATLRDDPNNPLFSKKILPFLTAGMVNCTDLIAACSFNGDTKQCKEKFRFALTDTGGSCTFNIIPQQALRKNVTMSTLMEANVTLAEMSQWMKFNMDQHLIDKANYDEKNGGQKKEETFPLRQKAAGQPFGLSFLAVFDLKKWACPQMDSAGIRLGIVSPIDESNVKNVGIGLQPNHEIFVNVYPEVSLADESIYSLSAERRGCYKYNEYQLKYYNHYTLGNCLSECLSDQIAAQCNCSLLTSPKFPGTPLCDPEQRQCAKLVETTTFGDNPEKVCKQCLPNCNDIQFKYTISSMPYDPDNLPALVENNPNWRNQTSMLVHIGYAVASVVPTIRKLSYDFWEIFAYVGGIFGVLLGNAFIDFGYYVETVFMAYQDLQMEVYTISLLAAWIRRRRRRRRAIIQPPPPPNTPNTTRGEEIQFFEIDSVDSTETDGNNEITEFNSNVNNIEIGEANSAITENDNDNSVCNIISRAETTSGLLVNLADVAFGNISQFKVNALVSHQLS